MVPYKRLREAALIWPLSVNLQCPLDLLLSPVLCSCTRHHGSFAWRSYRLCLEISEKEPCECSVQWRPARHRSDTKFPPHLPVQLRMGGTSTSGLSMTIWKGTSPMQLYTVSVTRQVNLNGGSKSFLMRYRSALPRESLRHLIHPP